MIQKTSNRLVCAYCLHCQQVQFTRPNSINVLKERLQMRDVPELTVGVFILLCGNGSSRSLGVARTQGQDEVSMLATEDLFSSYSPLLCLSVWIVGIEDQVTVV